MVHEDAAHEVRCKPEEVRAALPVHRLLIHQPHEGFVHQRRALDRVVRPFAPQVPLRERAQLLVDEPGELAERLLIATAPLGKQLSNRSIRRVTHEELPDLDACRGRRARVRLIRNC